MRPVHFNAPVLAFLTVTMSGCGGCGDKDTPADTSIEEPPEITNDVGQYMSMDAFSDGTVAVSYYDRSKGALAYATWSGERWYEERIDGYPGENGLDPGDRGKYTSLVIDNSDTAWISYYDATNGNLFYAKRLGDDEWETGIADVGGGATPNAGQFSSMALDGSDNPVIAHYDANRGQLRVAHYNDGSFSGEIVDEGEDVTPDTGGDVIEADVGRYAHLFIDGDDEYIAYYDGANGDLKLAQGSAGSYTISVIDSEGDVGQWPSIAKDGSELLIAYHDVGNQDLKLARVDGSGGVTTETIDTGDFVGADTEIFLNGSFPAILYFDGNENNLKYAEYGGSEWTTDTVAGADAALGFHNETVEVNGTRYIGCYDYTNRTIWFSEL